MHHHMVQGARTVRSAAVSETLFRTPRLTRGSTLVSKTGESGTMNTPGGDFPVGFVFKSDGAKLTGTMIGMDGMELPITNGKIDGDKISYTVTIDFGGMMLELVYKGVVTASEIKLDMSVFDMPFQFVVKKEK